MVKIIMILPESFFKYFEFQAANFVEVVLISMATLLCFTLVFLLMRKRANYPPGPTGLPVVGYVPFLGKEPHKTLANMRNKYGDIIGLYMGSTYTVILNEYSVMKEVLCHPSALNRGPKIFEHIPSVGFLSSNGEEWLEQRRFCLSLARDLGLGRGTWENVIMEEVQSFLTELRNFQGRPTDIFPALNYSISSNIISLLLGRRFKKDEDADKIKLSLEFSDVSLIYTGPLNAATVIPGLRKYLEFFKISGYDTSAKIIQDFANFVREEITNHKTSPEFRDVHDFINSYLEKLYSMASLQKTKHYFTEKNLEGNLTTLFLGSSDTIFSSLGWLFVLMAAHPEIQIKVHKELMDVVGKDGTARYEERQKFPFTFAVLMESQRFSTIVPLSTTRKAGDNIAIRGYVIPKGAEIVTNLWSLHNDPNYWDEPEKFRPDRFLTNDGTTFIKSPQSYAPFSVGRRNCPGETIAWMEIFAYFTEVIKRFEVAPAPGKQVQFNIIHGLLSRLEPQPLRFIERKA